MALTHTQIKDKLLNQLNVKNMGLTRIYKFVMKLTNNEDKALVFMIREGYQPYEIKKAIYNMNYCRQRYQHLKSANAIVLKEDNNL